MLSQTISVRAERIWKHDTSRAILILLTILNVSFYPCIWKHKTFMASARDAASIMPDGAWAGTHVGLPFPKTLDEGVPGYMTEPWFKLLGYQYRQEKNAPLWNPYQAFGMPLAANMESQPFYPLTMALSLHLTPKTYNLYILLRLLVAGICMYLYLRFFVSFLPALAGGIIAMLAGYYVLFLTMQQLSVEVLLPAGLLAGECLLRRTNYRTTTLFALVVFLALVGGMPESSFVLLVFLYVYLVFRIASDPDLRSGWLREGAHLFAASIGGLLLSAILLLPFLELLKLSFDLHQPSNLGGLLMGLVHDRLDASITTYIFPLILGPPSNTRLTVLRNYVGVIALFLIIISAIALGQRRRQDRTLNSLTWFALLSVVFVLLKRYGFPLINSIGVLPVLRLINFPKYEELILSISASILCAIGLERIVKHQLPKGQQWWAFLLTTLIAGMAVVGSRARMHQEIALHYYAQTIPQWAIIVGCGSLILLACSLLFSRRGTPGPWDSPGLNLSSCLFGLLTGEMLLAYIFPVYYLYNYLPSAANNPYVGAPYIDVLRKETQGIDRIFCRDGLLFPDWASAFHLLDIRDVGAMYYKKYFNFLHAFLPVPANDPSGELSNRFNGTGPYYFKDPLSRRLLQLSSVKYIGTIWAFATPNRRVEEVLHQNAGHLLPGREANIAQRDLILDDEAREGLGEHPPYERLPYTLDVSRAGDPIFYFSYGLDRAVFDKTAGDGVGFTIEAKNATGEIKKLFYSYIDPKHNLNERHWMNGKVDLSPYRGQRIELLFSTDPGPKGDTSYDWAAWSNFHFTDELSESSHTEEPAQLFHPVYSGEANIYRYDHVLPRASLYTHAEIAHGGEDALRKLADPSLNIFQNVVLDATDLNAQQLGAINAINQSAPRAVQAARITSYHSQSVDMEASLARSAILVLNDSDYPGWTVEVDGHPQEWFTANYIFRGVLLPPGMHSVQFAYKPRSFYYGVVLSLAAVLGFTIWGLAERWAVRRRSQYPVDCVS
jgi:hypothetical protein